MPSKSTVYSALQYVASSLSPYLPLANCHTVDVLVYDMWSKVLPRSLQQDLDKTSVDVLCQMLGPSDKSQQMLGSVKEECPALHEFLSLLHSLHLSCLGVLSSKEEVYHHLQMCSEAAPVDLGRLMSEKKMHEVTIMAQLVATLCRELGATWVCDVGAGKGYLSALLAKHYKLNVLAVDSSPGNVNAAKMYSLTLQRELNRQRKNKRQQFANDGQVPLHLPAYVGSSSDSRDGGAIVPECCPYADIQIRSENCASVNGVPKSCSKAREMCGDCQEPVSSNDDSISLKSEKTVAQTSEISKNFLTNSLRSEEDSVGCCDQCPDLHNSSRTFSPGEDRDSVSNQRPKIEASQSSSRRENRDSDTNERPKTEATAQYLCIVKHVSSNFCILDTVREAFYLNEFADSADLPSNGSRSERRHYGRKKSNKRKPALRSEFASSLNARDNFDVRSGSESKEPRSGIPEREIEACSLGEMSSKMGEEMSRLRVDVANSNGNIGPLCSSESSNVGRKDENFTIINNPMNDLEIKSADTSKNEPLDCGRRTESLHCRKSKGDNKKISEIRRSFSLGRNRDTLAKNDTRLSLRDKSEPSDADARNNISPPNFTINEPLVTKDPMELRNRSELLNSEGKKPRRRNPAPAVGKACVCALHACGDLAVHALRTYLADDTAVVSCTVGCCYHLVTEGTGDVGLHAPQISPSYPPGFPLSPLLRGYRLGRSARMAASQPLPRRMKTGLQDSESRSHYWRALLQLVIVRQLHRVSHPADSRRTSA